ncbi:unnamed protein product [Candidula unifasciata]|uniref:MOB kinase activator-like 2 n=1 Tax=Candidula unifasciata TaxID=100452 RepID=A0A8S3ZY25_9EUPU|nr:unnamed protein product [Candidula unifasciata]
MFVSFLFVRVIICTVFCVCGLKGRRKDKDSPTPTEEQKEYLEDPNIKNRISDADFFRLVTLPPMLDLNEWLATHTMSFFNHVNLIYGAVSEYCTAETCSSMTAPDNVQYFWVDDKGKKTKQTAPQYIDYVMTHIQKVINDESIFPTKYGNPFPPDLEATVKRIYKYLFHVLAHLYHAHYKLLRQLDLHAHLNTLFTHFMVFTSKFDLVQDKESDNLLLLFSLLLKNLADPSQNPKLREGLGLGDAVLGPPHDKSTDISKTVEDSDKSTAEVTTTETIQECNNDGRNLPACDKDSGCHIDNGTSQHNELNRMSLSLSLSSHLSSHEGKELEGDMIESDPSRSPSEWLSNLQLSAT